jgi:hypothetical protein
MATEDEELAALRAQRQKETFKSMFAEAMTEWVEANKPKEEDPEKDKPPVRTEKPKGGFLDSLFS